MAEACSVCQRPDRAEIDAALDAGEGLNATARRFGLSRGAIQRHSKHRDAKPEKVPEAGASREPTPEPFEPGGSSWLEPGSNLARAGSNPSEPRAPEPAPALPPSEEPSLVHVAAGAES